MDTIKTDSFAELFHAEEERTTRLQDVIQGVALAFDPLPRTTESTFWWSDAAAMSCDLARLAGDRQMVFIETDLHGAGYVVHCKADAVTHGSQSKRIFTKRHLAKVG